MHVVFPSLGLKSTKTRIAPVNIPAGCKQSYVAAGIYYCTRLIFVLSSGSTNNDDGNKAEWKRNVVSASMTMSIKQRGRENAMSALIKVC